MRPSRKTRPVNIPAKGTSYATLPETPASVPAARLAGHPPRLASLRMPATHRAGARPRRGHAGRRRSRWRKSAFASEARARTDLARSTTARQRLRDLVWARGYPPHPGHSGTLASWPHRPGNRTASADPNQASGYFKVR